MKAFLIFILCCAGILSCKEQDKAPLRKPFNAKGLHVITVFANRQQKTMSVLYGNEAAVAAAHNGNDQHANGHLFKLVTYKQENNEFWYGSYINGAVLSVENIMTNENNRLTYQLEEGNPVTDSTGAAINNTDRINYILAHKAAVIP